ncbi:MAG: leucine-rich repeat domain-containing protein, partial [Bacteroidota bacterium]
MRKIYILLLILVSLCIVPSMAQKKKSQSQAKKPATTVKKKSTPGVAQQGKFKAGRIPASKIDTFRLQVIPLVKFYESTLNFLADKRNPVNEKQTVITQSYLKFTWDEEVQVEDDLDDNRLVPLYKDMSAYLSDVDFFFRGAKFQYAIQDVSLMANQDGLNYFRVTANRNLKGVNLNGDSINSNKVRYIEINYDSVKQQLKIVSVYTTKLNEQDDLRRWWNGLSQGWKEILAKDLAFDDKLAMLKIDHYNDTVAMVDGVPKQIDGTMFYQFLNQIIHTPALDISGIVVISNLEPVSKLSELTSVNISGTPVSDLMPLRNLNKLESLDISNTSVVTLEPLRYCTNLHNLKLRGTAVGDLNILTVFPALESLDISSTKATSLDPVKEIISLRDLRLRLTPINDLTPLSGLTNLEMLVVSKTPVESLEPLKNLSNLRILFCDSTSVSSLVPLDGLSGLQKVYGDKSKITDREVRNFLKKHPGASLIYQSEILSKWWSALSAEWQKLFDFYVDVSDPPTTEQLHRLVLTDSININGRTTVGSLEPVSRFIMLRNLQCQSTSVNNLAPLTNLTDLRVINASNTQIPDVEPLSGLSNLEILQIDNTTVKDLSPLYGLASLQMVFADNSKVDLAEANRFFDKNPGSMLIFQSFDNSNWWKNLGQPWKDVFQQQLKLIGSPDKIQLQQISNLDKIVISENFQITDLAPVLHLPRLTELQFSGTAISKLDPVR